MSYAMEKTPRFPPPPTNLPRLTEVMYWAARGALSDRFPGWSDDDLDHLWDAINTARRVQRNGGTNA